jgi:hypothetical protein
MADDSKGHGRLFLLLGVLVVAVAMLAAMITGHMPGFGPHHRADTSEAAPAAAK